MAATTKSQLDIKDELDMSQNSSTTLDVKPSSSSSSSSPFCMKDNSGGLIKDEFSDEIDQEDTEGNASRGNATTELEGEDQSTEDEEFNDAEEIKDELSMDEEEDGESQTTAAAAAQEFVADHSASRLAKTAAAAGQNGAGRRRSSRRNNIPAEEEEEEEDPLNEGNGSNTSSSAVVENGDVATDDDETAIVDDAELEDVVDDASGVIVDDEDHQNGEGEEEEGEEGDLEMDVEEGDNTDPLMGDDEEDEENGVEEGDAGSGGVLGGGGTKRKLSEEKGGEGEEVTVRKSSRIRNILDSRKEKEDSLLQGKSVHDSQKEKTKMLQKPSERPSRLNEETEQSENETEKEESEEPQGPAPVIQGDPTRAPGADSKQKIDLDFLLPFRAGWTREVVYRPVKTGPPQVDIFYWPPKDAKDPGVKSREFRRKRRSKVDQERYFEEFPHPFLSVLNFSYVRRPLGLNNEAYELVRQEIRSGLETRSDKRSRTAGKVTSYKEVAEHEGLLSGSSSDDEPGQGEKEEDVEDVTLFDQGLPLSLQVLERITPLRDEYKKRHKIPDRETCVTPPLAADLPWTFLDDDPMGVFTELGGRSSPATPPPLRALRLTSHSTVESVINKHKEIKDNLPDPLVRIRAEAGGRGEAGQLQDNLASHDNAIRKFKNFRPPLPSGHLRINPAFQRGGRLGGGGAGLHGRAQMGGVRPPMVGRGGGGVGRPTGSSVGFVKVRLPMLSTNGKRPVVELVMLTNGKYQPIKFTNNRQVSESIPKRLFDQANLLRKTLYQRSVQVPKIGTKQVFVAINPAPPGSAGGVARSIQPAPANNTAKPPAHQHSDQVSILVRPAQGGNAVLLNVPRSVALKVKVGTTLSFSASNDQKYTVIDNRMHPPVGKGKPQTPPQSRGPSQQLQQHKLLQQQQRLLQHQLGRATPLPILPSGVSIRPINRQPQPPLLHSQQQQQQEMIRQQQQQQIRQQQQQIRQQQNIQRQKQQLLLQKQRAAAAQRTSDPDLSSFTPCSPFCPGASGIPELECSSCHSLFHPKCVGIPAGRLSLLAASFKCKGCIGTVRPGGPKVQVIDLD